MKHNKSVQVVLICTLVCFPLFNVGLLFLRDMETYCALNPRIDRMTAILQTMNNTNLLLGYDIDYNSCAYTALGEKLPNIIDRVEHIPLNF